MAFVWDVLRRLCDGIDRPLILFIHDVEHTLCSSFERYDAFEDAFGQRSRPAQPLPQERASMKLPLVVVGGCALGESGTHITPSTRFHACTAASWPCQSARCHSAPHAAILAGCRRWHCQASSFLPASCSRQLASTCTANSLHK